MVGVGVLVAARPGPRRRWGAGACRRGRGVDRPPGGRPGRADRPARAGGRRGGRADGGGARRGAGAAPGARHGERAAPGPEGGRHVRVHRRRPGGAARGVPGRGHGRRAAGHRGPHGGRRGRAGRAGCAPAGLGRVRGPRPGARARRIRPRGRGGDPALLTVAGPDRPGGSRRRGGPVALAGRGADDQGRRRRGRRGPFRPGRARRRAACPGGGDHGLGQVRAPPDPHRRPVRGQHPAGDDVRPGGLQGGRGVQGLRPPAPHGRNGHRPGRAPDLPGPGVPGRRAATARAPVGPRQC